MSASFKVIGNIAAPPFRIPIYDDKENRIMNSTWVRWFNDIYGRVGGASGAVIYDNAVNAQALASLEPQLFAIRAELEAQLTGVLLSIIEQVQEQTFDISGLVSDITPEPPSIPPPDDFYHAGIIQQALDGANVQSVFGRTGAVVATEGDYTLTQLGDVTITAPSSSEILRYNGTNWVNAAPSFVAPGYQEFVATAAQTVFNTTINTTAKAAGKAYLQIYVNGIFQQEGTTKAYTVTGANQVTFNAGVALASDVVMYSYS